MGLKDNQVRPTQARVRKSMLQILEPFRNCRVLDLYSGIGSLGIEALSRGAEQVTFVENNFQAIRALQKNLDTICPDDNVQVFRGDVDHFLAVTSEEYDIIMADPPYGTANFEDLKELIKPALKPSGIFCLEMKKTRLEEEDVRIKLYGRTQVVFWRP